MNSNYYFGNVQKDLWVFEDKILAFNENIPIKFYTVYNIIGYVNSELKFRRTSWSEFNRKFIKEIYLGKIKPRFPDWYS